MSRSTGIHTYMYVHKLLLTNPVRSLYSFFLLLLPMKIKSIKHECMHVRSYITTFNKLHTCIATTILCSTHIYTVCRETLDGANIGEFGKIYFWHLKYIRKQSICD